MRHLVTLPLIAVLLLAAVPALAQDAPEARGKLSLAWDEWESGRCEGVLKYVQDIESVEGEGAGELAEDAAWLKVECLKALGRFGPAVPVLMTEEASGYEWRDDSLESLLSQWAWEAQKAEDFTGAQEILKRGQALLPESTLLSGEARALSFRREFGEAIRARREGRLSGGGEVRYLPLGKTPSQPGFVRACPPPADPWWAVWEDCEKWLPTTGASLKARGEAAWVAIPRADYETALKFEARNLGMEVAIRGDTAHFTMEECEYALDLKWERLRAAVEGLGVRGGALLAAGPVFDNLSSQGDLMDWLGRHSEEVAVKVESGAFVARHKKTRRVSRFALSEWSEYFRQDREGWEKLWGEIAAELGHEKRPFKCFCGRDMVLRETLTSAWDGLVPVWNGQGVASVLVAYCPLHWLLVTGEILDNWGATKAQAVERAKSQAVETAWDVDFERGGAGGGEYLALHGTGISGFVRRPALLLGLLQAVEGRDLSGTSVRVWTPMSDALVVAPSGADEGAGTEGSRKVAEMSGEPGLWARQLKYSATLKLPAKPEGTFNLTSAQRQ